jgi:hypothetical protein
MGQARLVDVCERGLAMELPEKPQPNTYIRFQCDKMKLYGTGAVRHTQSIGAKFIVGLEFSDGVRWKPPLTVVTDGEAPLQAPRTTVELDSLEWNWLFDRPADARVSASASGND